MSDSFDKLIQWGTAKDQPRNQIILYGTIQIECGETVYDWPVGREAAKERIAAALRGRVCKIVDCMMDDVVGYYAIEDSQQMADGTHRVKVAIRGPNNVASIIENIRLNTEDSERLTLDQCRWKLRVIHDLTSRNDAGSDAEVADVVWAGNQKGIAMSAEEQGETIAVDVESGRAYGHTVAPGLSQASADGEQDSVEDDEQDATEAKHETT